MLFCQSFFLRLKCPNWFHFSMHMAMIFYYWSSMPFSLFSVWESELPQQAESTCSIGLHDDIIASHLLSLLLCKQCRWIVFGLLSEHYWDCSFFPSRTMYSNSWVSFLNFNVQASLCSGINCSFFLHASISLKYSITVNFDFCYYHQIICYREDPGDFYKLLQVRYVPNQETEPGAKYRDMSK